MSVSEYERHQIFQWFEESMGPERAAAMMHLLPPVGWGDIVTGTELRGEMAKVHGELAELRGEIAETRGEIAETRGEIAETRGEIARSESRLRDEIARLRFQMYATAIGGNVALAGVILAATQVG